MVDPQHVFFFFFIGRLARVVVETDSIITIQTDWCNRLHVKGRFIAGASGSPPPPTNISVYAPKEQHSNIENCKLVVHSQNATDQDDNVEISIVTTMLPQPDCGRARRIDILKTGKPTSVQSANWDKRGGCCRDGFSLDLVTGKPYVIAHFRHFWDFIKDMRGWRKRGIHSRK